MMIEITDKILNKIETIISRKLSDNQYNNLLSLSNKLYHAVTVQKGIEADIDVLYKFGREEIPEDYILNRLGHLSANPSKPDNKEILIKTYQHKFTEEYRDPNREKEFVNLNKSASTLLYNELINESKREREYYLKNLAASGRHVFVLSGYRGSGKTIFLNYFLSEFNDDFNKEHVIFVRINLTEDFAKNYDLKTLNHWLLSKATYLIFRYYMNFPEFSTLFNFIENKILSDYSLNKKKLMDNLDDIKKMYFEKKQSETLLSTTINTKIAREVVEFAIQNEYSFIYVLDGFDQIDIHKKYQKRLSDLHNAIDKLINPNNKFAGCYLIVTRIETLYALFNEPNYSSTNNNVNYIRLSIYDILFHEIIEARLKYLKSKLKYIDIAKKKSKKKWDTHLDEFYEYLAEMSGVPNFHLFTVKMQDNFGSNNRAKMQVVQLIYSDFLINEREPRRYNLIETMCRSGFKFPPNIYSYSIKNRKLFVDKRLKLFDNIFLPSLTNFPYHCDYQWKTIPFANTYILAMYRTLQVLQAYTRHYREPILYIPASKIINILRKLFNYEEAIIQLILEQFSEFNFITLSGASIAFPFDWSNIRIRLNTKFSIIMEGIRNENLINDIAYLNLSSMRTLISKSALSADIPFFKALTLDMRTDGQSKVAEWITWKIINAISLYRTLMSVCEKENADEKKHKLDEEFVRNYQWDNFVINLKKQMKSNLDTLITPKQKPYILESIMENLIKYEKEWVE